MGRGDVLRLKGAQNLRLRLLLATLAGSTLRVDEIRANESAPGLRDYEASFLRLLEKISSGCTVEINETGTKLRYIPGIVTAGKGLVHDCGTSRAIGFYLEPLIVLGLFGKSALHITLKGVTNDWKDPCVDTFRTTTLPMLRQFGVPEEGLELTIVSRGAPPSGGGEVRLKVPVVPTTLTAVRLEDEGMIKGIKGVAYSTRVSPQMSNRMVDAARGELKNLIRAVHLYTDHVAGKDAGRSPGFGISLVAETTSGCLLSADCAADHSNDAGDEEPAHGKRVVLPEEIGAKAARLLLEEIRQRGVVDSTHQGFVFLLCALCPEDVSKVRVGKLTPHGIRTLRHIKAFLGVQFSIRPDEGNGTVLLSCVGSGYRNLSRKIS